ncbi:ATP-binding protein [Actinomadura scrupuli]|uniref:ATP-binding protein n=1 Tax=Actinomadura scrupuli TaxID=559629 RepID=UPI003D955ECC
MVTGKAADIAAGGVCSWQLPPDPSCAQASRSLIRTTMTTLGLDAELIDAAVLAVSEQATNALLHGTRTESYEPVVPAELWVWARTAPTPQLVVAVFDTGRDQWPGVGDGELLDEHGKGIGIVAAVAQAWGTHLSRARLSPRREPGKVVWSAFGLPGPWPDPGSFAPPGRTARHLATLLSARGAEGVGHRDERGVSLVTVPLSRGGGLNIWIEPKRCTFTDTDGTRVQRLVIDISDLAEHLVRRIEEDRARSG